ncbi:GNAT family N-acetyltransferase [Ornithinimicrobium humiphilum]|uniref:Putative acetyltransferase n=1 Tax=Ornithinimicrobium humiphilum TaxID=125288 RepID=A0A543KRJ9_9MICO|nr:GNAT family N-acetyltransferase [Ornithinimicrobium humiphilum]TQM97705.1 putative acetyltransferase [Ornithinimicrobium humiphilum]
MSLVLRPPTVDDEEPLRALHAELLPEGFEVLLAEGTWSEILAQVRREAEGTDLPEGRVPADFLVAEVDGEIVGRVSIRHRLTPFLLAEGGHVGYAVAPAHRRRGHATEMLRQSVARLAALGVDRVLVTCDDDNLASARTIEANGGVLEDVVPTGPGRPAKRRYWIDASR